MLIISQLKNQKQKGTYFDVVKLHTAPGPAPGRVLMLVLHPYQHLRVREPLSSRWHPAGLWVSVS